MLLEFPTFNQPEVYEITVVQGDGFSLIARKAITEYRNDYGQFADPVVRLYAENSLMNALSDQFKTVQKDHVYVITEQQIRQLLVEGNGMNEGTYKKLAKYVPGFNGERIYEKL
jgi:hypothetical protein